MISICLCFSLFSAFHFELIIPCFTQSCNENKTINSLLCVGGLSAAACAVLQRVLVGYIL